MVRELPKEYKRSNDKRYIHKQDIRNDKAALYSVYYNGHFEGYEVFKIIVGNPHPKDPDQNPKEKQPGNEDFGKWAWYFPKNQSIAANLKFSELSAVKDG